MYPQVSGKQNSGMSIGSNLIEKVEKTSNLGLEMSNVLKWSFHVRAKRAKAQRSFNYLQQKLHCSLPNNVKHNLNFACFFHFCFMILRRGMLILVILD